MKLSANVPGESKAAAAEGEAGWQRSSPWWQMLASVLHVVPVVRDPGRVVGSESSVKTLKEGLGSPRGKEDHSPCK